jgi:hypothetical protein
MVRKILNGSDVRERAMKGGAFCRHSLATSWHAMCGVLLSRVRVQWWTRDGSGAAGPDVRQQRRLSHGAS